MRTTALSLLLLVAVGMTGWCLAQWRRVTTVERRLAEVEFAWEAARQTATGLRAQLQTRERELAARTAERDAAQAGLADRERQLATVTGRVAELETELQAEVGRRQEVDALIEQTATTLRAERERHNKEIWQARRFMPEGVRVTLVTANDRLREDGHGGFRFLKAMRIEEQALHDVQALDQDPGTLSSTVYIAKRVKLALDRSKGTLLLRFFDGYSRGPDGRQEFGADGYALTFPDVDGRQWERQLPLLVQATGEYPRPVAAAPQPRMERSRRLGWLRRVNSILEGAKTDKRYRLETFRNLQSGRFQDVLLLGYDDKKNLAMSAEATSLAIHVDDRGQFVELVLTDGVLRKPGGETPIPAGGYRIRLPGIEPARAIDSMLGMVKRQ